MAMLLAAHYGETVEALKADAIVKAMMEGTRGNKLAELAHEDGGARGSFMIAALREYQARGGKIESHIGGVAEAILALRAEKAQEMAGAVYDTTAQIIEEMVERGEIQREEAAAKLMAATTAVYREFA